MALKVVGSNPIIHPIKTNPIHSDGVCFYLVVWDSKGRPERSEGNKQSGGLFLRVWENPWKADGTPQGVLVAFHLSDAFRSKAVHCINL